MKKLFLFALALTTLLACEDKGKTATDETRERDSLLQVLSQKDEELEDLMASINDVQEGFRRINEAEGRITIANGNPESNSSKETIRENIEFIQDAMRQNRERIAELQQKLKTTSFNAASLQKTIENLQAQMESQNQRIQELEASLAEKDITIAQQGEQIDNLNENVNTLTQENKQKSQTVATQDKEINKAWYVFGTKRELKEEKILQDGDILKNGDFNKSYFTEIDIRTMKEIPFYSKSAKLLTTHPAGSYSLVKGSDGDYTLKINNAKTFWSISKYLVVLVK